MSESNTRDESEDPHMTHFAGETRHMVVGKLPDNTWVLLHVGRDVTEARRVYNRLFDGSDYTEVRLLLTRLVEIMF
jgi:hypothetical protein